MIGVVLGFHSPAGYALPRQHLQGTIRHVLASGATVAVAQAVRPGGRPEPVPAGVATGVWWTSQIMFFKENLWNLGATLLPRCDVLVFCDSDVYWPDSGWLGHVRETMRVADIAQPFEVAAWLDRTGQESMRRPAAAVAIAAGREPRLGGYHPGFAWAVTRDAYARIGGWYDRCPQGGGDCAIAFALADDAHGESMAARVPLEAEYWHRASYRAWRSRVRELRLRVAYPAGLVIRHRWHGERSRRLYHGRSSYMPQVGHGEYPLERRPDGLLRWTDEAASDRAADYFAYRCEDG